MMRPDAKVEKMYLYPKPVDFRKSIDGLAALVELDNLEIYHLRCPRDQQYTNVEEVSPGA
jgi:hypothetical protein